MLIVTRPREQAQDWVSRLQARGVGAAAVPLLEIVPLADVQPLRQAWQQAEHWHAVMFVSPNAVAAFFAAVAGWPGQCLAVAPGPGTAQALQAHGVSPNLIVQPPADSLQFDSEALWPQLQAWPWVDRRVLVVRGHGGRDWLMQRWQQAGAQVHSVTAYRRGPPVPTEPEQRALAHAVQHPGQVLWLLSSAEALEHLCPLMAAQFGPSFDFRAWAAKARALATHPRILEQAHAQGLVHAQACRADLDSVVASYNAAHRER